MDVLIERIVSKRKYSSNKEEIVAVVHDDIKYSIIAMYSIFILISGLYFNNMSEIIQGLRAIVLAPSILVSDYIAVGNIGSTLVNAGILMLVSIWIGRISKVEMNGPLIAAVITTGGFAFLGKNIYNVWAIFLGVYLYTLLRGEKFSKYILVALFGTALGPMVSQISFALDLPIISGILLGNIFGIVAGFIMPSLAGHFSKFHQGYNLYNMGFTAGITGTLFMSFLRAYGKDNETLAIVSSGNNILLGTYLSIIFSSMIILGYVLNNKSFRGYKDLIKYSGKGNDFVSLVSFPVSLINMGVIGFISTAYVILVNGQINGPNIAGILTIVGFGAFGKHPRNILPIFAGVYIACMTQVWEANTTASLLAALFGTTLAPIAGEYGWKIGIVAGFTHIVLVMNTGYLHGGMNLYNNGFAGGIVAAILVTVINGIMKKDQI